MNINMIFLSFDLFEHFLHNLFQNNALFPIEKAPAPAQAPAKRLWRPQLINCHISITLPTLSLWAGSAPWANRSSTTAKCPPAQARDSTVWSLVVVVRFTSAPTTKILHFKYPLNNKKNCILILLTFVLQHFEVIKCSECWTLHYLYQAHV